MCLTGICYYPYQTDIRKFTVWRHRRPKIQSRRHRAAFVGVSPQKASISKLKCETLDISVIFNNPYSVLSCNHQPFWNPWQAHARFFS